MSSRWVRAGVHNDIYKSGRKWKDHAMTTQKIQFENFPWQSSPVVFSTNNLVFNSIRVNIF